MAIDLYEINYCPDGYIFDLDFDSAQYDYVQVPQLSELRQPAASTHLALIRFSEAALLIHFCYDGMPPSALEAARGTQIADLIARLADKEVDIELSLARTCEDLDLDGIFDGFPVDVQDLACDMHSIAQGTKITDCWSDWEPVL